MLPKLYYYSIYPLMFSFLSHNYFHVNFQYPNYFSLSAPDQESLHFSLSVLLFSDCCDQIGDRVRRGVRETNGKGDGHARGGAGCFWDGVRSTGFGVRGSGFRICKRQVIWCHIVSHTLLERARDRCSLIKAGTTHIGLIAGSLCRGFLPIWDDRKTYPCWPPSVGFAPVCLYHNCGRLFGLGLR